MTTKPAKFFNLPGVVLLLFALFVLLPRCAFLPGPGNSDFTKKISRNYYIIRSSAHQIIISPKMRTGNTQMIPTKVVECDYDSKFVIARQQELQPRNPGDGYRVPAPGKYHYWILDTKKPHAYGPMTLEEFSSQRKMLGVSERLTLKDVYSFRPWW